MKQQIDVQHKIVFLGDSNTGKTSIIYKYLKLAQQPFPTIAASSFPVTVTVQDIPVSLSCWDTAGQENYRGLVPMYARDAEVACLVFDQSNPASFVSLEKWLDYIKNEIQVPNVIVVSNKSDLQSMVPVDKVLEFCNARKLPLVETSAVTGNNLGFLFAKIGEVVVQAWTDRLKIDGGINLSSQESTKETCC
jgi:small GTP-binding protein